MSKAGGHFPWPAEEEMNRWSQQLLERQQWLEQAGTVPLVAVAPNKHTIYPEQAPPWLPFQQPDLTRYLVSRARAEGVKIVDTAPLIAQQRCCVDWLYNKTDSHWTLPGAYLGYREVMLALAESIPSLSFLGDESVTFEQQPVPGGGLVRMLGISSFYKSRGDVGYRANFQSTADRMCARNTSVDFEVTGECEAVEDRNMQAGLYAVQQLSNPDALNDLSVLIVQDSFGLAPSRFFNHSFKTVWHAHLGYILNGDRLKEFVTTFQPDIVLYLVIERNLLRPIVYEFDGKSNISSPIIE